MNIFLDRINCWKNTKYLCDNLHYVNNPKTSIKYYYDNNFKSSNINSNIKSNIKIFNIDTLDLAINCINNGLNPLILNLADDLYPGGHVNMGSGAQEESLFRRTNYYKTLLPNYYPIKSNEAIYSSDVSIIKLSEEQKYKLLNPIDIKKTSFIACPALKYPNVFINNSNEKRLNENDILILKNKIKLIIQIAYKNNHDTIIFGAMGCGAWENPSKHVAEIFKDVLNEYSNIIPNYYFAILSMNNNNYIKKIELFDNYNIFNNILLN